MASLGYGLARWQVLELAKNMAEAIDIENEPTPTWFLRFKKRFPMMKMTQPKKRYVKIVFFSSMVSFVSL